MADLTPRRRTLALAVVALAMAMDIVDTTIVNIAIPSLQADLSASPSAIQWMIAGYSMIFAILLVSGGRLGDIWGYRKTFLAGVTGFVLASLLCGLATTPSQLVLARLVQGGAAAIMLPQVMSLTQIMYAPHERIAPLSLFGALGGLSAALGPILGGLLIGANLFGLQWRPIFLINVPIGLLALVAGAWLLPPGGSAHAPRLDPRGTVLVMAVLFLILFPLIEGRAFGWPWWTFAMLAAAAAAAWLVVRDSRLLARNGGSPLILPALFHDRAFAVGLLITLTFEIAMAGFLLVLTLTLQDGIGLSATSAGIVHLPFALGAAASIALLARRVLPRYGPVVMTWGAGAMMLGLGGVALVIGSGVREPAWIALPMLLMGLGMGLTVGPLGACALSEIDPGHAGAASGLFKATQQLGAASGVALVGAIFFAAAEHAGVAGIFLGFRHAAFAIAAALAVAAGLALLMPRTLAILRARQPVPLPAA